METREQWIDSLAALPSADDIQRNRRMHQNQRGPATTHERVSVLLGSEREASMLSGLQASQNELMADQIISSERLLSQADWLPAERLAKMTVRRGPMFQIMGFSSGGCDFFFAEEALFLLETGHLELFYEGLPVTIQLAYSLLLSNDDLPYSVYRVYAHLLRGGYIAYHHRHHRQALARSSNPPRAQPPPPTQPPHRDSNYPDGRGNEPAMDSDDDDEVTAHSARPATVRDSPCTAVAAAAADHAVAATPWSDAAGDGDVTCPDWIVRNMARLMARGEQRLRAGGGGDTNPSPAAGDRSERDGSSTVDIAPAAVLYDERTSTCCRSGAGVGTSTTRHLLAGSDDITKENILTKLNMFSPPPEGRSGDEVVFDLDIYHHKPGFRKANPGEPNYYICIQGGPQTSAPSLSQIVSARASSHGVPVRWAVGDENRIHFYSLDMFSIPTLHPA